MGIIGIVWARLKERPGVVVCRYYFLTRHDLGSGSMQLCITEPSRVDYLYSMQE